MVEGASTTVTAYDERGCEKWHESECLSTPLSLLLLDMSLSVTKLN